LAARARSGTHPACTPADRIGPKSEQRAQEPGFFARPQFLAVAGRHEAVGESRLVAPQPNGIARVAPHDPDQARARPHLPDDFGRLGLWSGVRHTGCRGGSDLRDIASRPPDLGECRGVPAPRCGSPALNVPPHPASASSTQAHDRTLKLLMPGGYHYTGGSCPVK
jgi:hypothetical protein